MWRENAALYTDSRGSTDAPRRRLRPARAAARPARAAHVELWARFGAPSPSRCAPCAAPYKVRSPSRFAAVTSCEKSRPLRLRWASQRERLLRRRHPSPCYRGASCCCLRAARRSRDSAALAVSRLRLPAHRLFLLVRGALTRFAASPLRRLSGGVRMRCLCGAGTHRQHHRPTEDGTCC